MNLLREQIEGIVHPVVEKNNLLLIDLIVRGTEQNPVIEVFIDGEKSISAADCAEVSRDISSEIDDQSLTSSNYRLDVSSPGIDRPLIYLEQFPKHIDHLFEISYEQEGTTKKFKGRLISVNNSELTFKSDNQQDIVIDFSKIKRASALISFT